MDRCLAPFGWIWMMLDEVRVKCPLIEVCKDQRTKNCRKMMRMRKRDYRAAAPAYVWVANLVVGCGGMRVGALSRRVLEQHAVQDAERRTWESIAVMVGDELRP